MAASSAATVMRSRNICGCGRRTQGLLCCDCGRLDEYGLEHRRRVERLSQLRRHLESGASIANTCLACGHWNGQDCGMGIPECSLAFASLCNCFLPEDSP